MAARGRRPANSDDSTVGLKIFKLFSRPHDKTPNLTVFWEYHSENLNEMLPR